MESAHFRENQVHSEGSLIPKQDIIQVVILKEDKRYILDKESLALNTHVLYFLEKIEI